jgi:fatty acid desaturase
MDRAIYIKIRNGLDLEKKFFSLAIYILQDIALIAITAGIWNGLQASVLRFLVIPILFTIIFRGFGIMHEAVHGAVSKNRVINDAMGLLGGGLCLLPFYPWKNSHLQHHLWSGNVEKDPVMAFLKWYPNLPSGMQNFMSVLWQLWLPILGITQHFVFWRLSFAYLLKAPSKKALISLVLPLLLWGAAVSLVSREFTYGALIPALFIYFFAIEVVNLPHHLRLPQFRGDEKFPAWEQYQTARSCIYPKWLARFVVLNFNFHTEHHMFPDVPWYHLDKLQDPVGKALKENYNTDLYFGWFLENKKRTIHEVISSVDEKKPSKTSVA